MLLIFEIKRMIKGKDWIGLVVGMVVMILAAIINSIVVQPMFEGSISIQYDYYCGISQLMPFVFAPSIGNYLTKDYENNNDFFYKNIGISRKRYYLTRAIVLMFFGVVIIMLGSGVYFLKEKTDVVHSVGILVILILQYIYTLLLSCLLAFYAKKRIFTIVIIIFGTMILSILNVLPLPLIQGRLFMLDGHSIITENVNAYLTQNDMGCYWNCIIRLLVWMFVLFGIYYIGIMKGQKGRKNEK